MGLGSHAVNDRNLRRLQRLTGLPLNRAFIRNHYCHGVVWNHDGTCTHYDIDKTTGEHEPVNDGSHFTSCPPRPDSTVGGSEPTP